MPRCSPPNRTTRRGVGRRYGFLLLAFCVAGCQDQLLPEQPATTLAVYPSASTPLATSPLPAKPWELPLATLLHPTIAAPLATGRVWSAGTAFSAGHIRIEVEEAVLDGTALVVIGRKEEILIRKPLPIQAGMGTLSFSLPPERPALSAGDRIRVIDADGLIILEGVLQPDPADGLNRPP